MNTAALTPPFSVIMNRIFPREVLAEIKLMAGRAPVVSTIGVSPRLSQVREAVMFGMDVRGSAKKYLSPSLLRHFLDFQVFW